MSWKRIAKASIEKKKPDQNVFENGDIPGIIDAMRKPTMHTYTTLNTWLKKCDVGVKHDILEQGGFEVLLNGLAVANSAKMCFGDAILQLQIVQCIKSVLNNEAGLVYLIESNDELLRDLVQSKCIFVQMVVFVVLSVLPSRPETLFSFRVCIFRICIRSGSAWQNVFIVYWPIISLD